MFTHEALWTGIELVARRRGWTLARLAVQAGLDPTALNRSKRIASDGKPRWPSMSTIAKLLGGANLTLADFCAMVEKPGHAEEVHGQNGHVLLVDDDRLFREEAADRLRGAGFRVLQAPGHRDALDLIEDGKRLDLLCTDIVMPEGMGGLALARIARSRRPGLDVLYVTGYELDMQRDSNIRVLRKPVEPQELVAEVERIIAQRPNRV